MPRKRERFERTDVPEPSPRRSLIGAVVAVAALAVMAGIVMFAWNRATLESRMGDRSLAGALSELSASSLAGPADGYVETGSEINSTLLLTASSLDAQGASLTAARILAVNATTGTATLVNVPTDLALTVDEQPTTLSELFSGQGYAACVAPLGRAAGLRFGNVILATDDVLEEAAQLAGSDAETLVKSASGVPLQDQDQHGRPGAALVCGGTGRDWRLQPRGRGCAAHGGDDHRRGRHRH